jgi:hypothetical protein
MNEPSNFDTNIPEQNKRLICPESKWDDPPYLPSKQNFKKKKKKKKCI